MTTAAPRPRPPPPTPPGSPPCGPRASPPLWVRRPAALAAALWIASACDAEPVLPGVPGERVVQERAPQPEAPSEAPRGYERPEGVLVDVQHLTSRPLREIKTEVIAQLGALVGQAPLEPGRGEELQLERGAVRVLDERIYYIAFPLPSPVRRADVLRLIGLPPQVGETIQTHREYRLNHERGLRRILMRRQDRRNELVVAVEVWKWLPGEHVNRR